MHNHHLAVADKLTDKRNAVLSTSELIFKRNALLDGITLLRAAATAATKPEEFESFVQTTLNWEQVCKLRRSIAPNGRGHMAARHHTQPSITCILEADFPKLSDSIANFGRWEWFLRGVWDVRDGAAIDSLAT